MLSKEEEKELEHLRAKQLSRTQFLSQEQFDRIKFLSNKQFSTSKKYNQK